MDELLPGVVHWTAVHPNHGQRVHSAFLTASGTLIDAIAPEDGLGWFERHRPRRALLTNRHHVRGAEAFRDAFGCTVHCHEAQLPEDLGDVQPLRHGDAPAPGVTVLALPALTPEEVALHIDLGPGVLAIADSVTRRRDGALGFFSDGLLGDDPAAVKRGIRDGLRAILDAHAFDALLLAHGEPTAAGARAELEAFVSAA